MKLLIVALPVLVVLTALTPDVHCYEIRGRVVDLLTQAGVSGVTVQLYTLDGKRIDVVKTDATGEFRRDVPEVHRRFRVSYLKEDGGPENLGYEGYARGAVENNVKNKVVDTIALRPRRRQIQGQIQHTREIIAQEWLAYYSVTKDQEKVEGAFRFYGIQDLDIKRTASSLQAETGTSPIKWAWPDKDVSDAAITASVKAKLAAVKVSNLVSIDVDTKNRVVSLNGVVESAEGKGRAERIAWEAKGVKAVENRLSVMK